MERSRRFILFLVATILAAPVMFKGRPPSALNGEAAFLSCTSAGVTIRVKGRVRFPGVYSFPDGVTVVDVINLTGSRPAGEMPGNSLLRRKLGNGEVVEVAGEDAQCPDIRVSRMKVGERMLFGIPLHPDRMDLEDWESLPGIGPKLARSIVEDRQDNGEFCSLEGVGRVPGVGEKKLAMIRKYFSQCATARNIK